MSDEQNNNPGNRFAPPTAQVADMASAGTEAGALAPRSTRFWAAMLDVAVGFLTMWLASRITPWNPWRDAGGGMWHINLNGVLGGFVLFVLVHSYLLAQRGQTVGKAVMKLRIVRGDRSRASLARLLGLRYGLGSLLSVMPALASVYGLIDSLMIFNDDRRCLHDVIADTIVIKA